MTSLPADFYLDSAFGIQGSILGFTLRIELLISICPLRQRIAQNLAQLSHSTLPISCHRER